MEWVTVFAGVGWNVNGANGSEKEARANKRTTKYKAMELLQKDIFDDCKATTAILLLQELTTKRQINIHIPKAFSMKYFQSHPLSDCLKTKRNEKKEKDEEENEEEEDEEVEEDVAVDEAETDIEKKRPLTGIIWGQIQDDTKGTMKVTERYGTILNDIERQITDKSVHELFTLDDTAVGKTDSPSELKLYFKRMAFVVLHIKPENHGLKILLGSYHGPYARSSVSDTKRKALFAQLIILMQSAAKSKTDGNFILSADTNINVHDNEEEQKDYFLQAFRNIDKYLTIDNMLTKGVDVVLWQSPNNSFELKEIVCKKIEHYIDEAIKSLNKEKPNNQKNYFDHQPIPFKVRIKDYSQEELIVSFTDLKIVPDHHEFISDLVGETSSRGPLDGGAMGRSDSRTVEPYKRVNMNGRYHQQQLVTQHVAVPPDGEFTRNLRLDTSSASTMHDEQQRSTSNQQNQQPRYQQQGPSLEVASMDDADAQGPSGASLSVFVFPSGIHFFVDEPHSHKQVLTLYNPYKFPLCYKILSTAPRKYSVVEPEGTLEPRCCVDIVIRHLVAATKANVGKSDKFRVQVQKYSEREVTGRKDVQATLHQSRRDAKVSEAQLRFGGTKAPSLRSRSSSIAPQQYNFPPSEYQRQSSSLERSGSTGVPPAQPQPHGQSYLIVLAAILCIGALMLPTHGDAQANSSSRLPDYLFLSVPQKLVAAYILGLVTMLLMWN